MLARSMSIESRNDVRRADHGGHCRQGAVIRGQRPHHRRTGARLPERRVAADRHGRLHGGAVESFRSGRGRRRHPRPPLGGLPRPGHDRDPRVRSGLDPGDEQDAGDAGRAPRGGTPPPPGGGGGRAGAPGRDRGPAVRATERSDCVALPGDQGRPRERAVLWAGWPARPRTSALRSRERCCSSGFRSAAPAAPSARGRGTTGACSGPKTCRSPSARPAP
jgi:hypothetical protein